jgi:hypothetical protein
MVSSVTEASRKWAVLEQPSSWYDRKGTSEDVHSTGQCSAQADVHKKRKDENSVQSGNPHTANHMQKRRKLVQCCFGVKINKYESTTRMCGGWRWTNTDRHNFRIPSSRHHCQLPSTNHVPTGSPTVQQDNQTPTMAFVWCTWQETDKPCTNTQQIPCKKCRFTWNQ